MILRSLLLSAAITLPVLASAGSLFSPTNIDDYSIVYVTANQQDTPLKTVNFSFTVNAPNAGGNWQAYPGPPKGWVAGDTENLSGHQVSLGDLDITNAKTTPATGALTITYLNADGTPTQKQCTLIYNAQGKAGNIASTTGQYCGGVTHNTDMNAIQFIVGPVQPT